MASYGPAHYGGMNNGIRCQVAASG
jgi:hypothetical protein